MLVVITNMLGEHQLNRALTLAITITVILSAITLSTGVVEAQQSENEPNGKKSNATHITTGTTVSGTLTAIDSGDWYSFDVSTPGTIYVNFDNPANLYVKLIGSDGNTLRSMGPFPDDISIDVDQPGTYYLQFTHKGLPPGGYLFNVSIEEETSKDEEPDPSDDNDQAEDQSSSPAGNTVTITKTGSAEGVAQYEFTVSGDLTPNDDFEDDINGATASGRVGPESGTDSVTFTGELTAISLDGPAVVLLNGNEIDPETYLDGTETPEPTPEPTPESTPEPTPEPTPTETPVPEGEDKWPDRSYNDAPIVDATGTHSGVLDVPDDVDYFRVKLQRGEFITVSTRVAPGHQDYRVLISGSSLTYRNHIEDDPDVTSSGRAITVGPSADGSGSSLEVLANEDTIVQFGVRDRNDDANYPYEWEVNLNKNSHEVQTLGSSDASQERIAELQTTIEEQQEQIEELRTQLDSRTQGQQVTINVEVMPSAEQDAFVAGEKALVRASSENADITQVAVQYQSGTYRLDENGQMKVPLVDAGPHELRVQYGDTAEVVELTVQEAPREAQQEVQQETQSDQEVQRASQRTTSSPSVPGFGIPAAVTAIALILLLIRRRGAPKT